MILNGNTLKKFMEKNILIENANLENIHSSSYDLPIDNYILKFNKNPNCINLIDVDTIDKMYKKVSITKGFLLKPNECLLIPLKDTFNLPNNICGHIRGRTSFNRLGIFITIQHLNPGYRGKLNLTIINNSTNTYFITPETKIAQVVFEHLDDNVSENLMYYNETSPFYYNEIEPKGSKIYGDYIGKVVRHFKGNYYYIENICMDSETKEYVVIYKNLYKREDSNIWTRPAKLFFESIDENRPDNITKQIHRFEVVEDLTHDYTK